MYVFDLDGTLLDTRAAVIEAYRIVGVTPPKDFFGRSWKEWLKDERKHREKNEAYRHCLGLIEELPLLEMLRNTNSMILTGASLEAVSLLRKRFFPTWFGAAHTELTIAGKVDILNGLDEIGMYFDDDESAINTVKKETKWATCHVRY
jgi:phosphoglycolate phosphatase-like HAD superfamily hydrolase